MNLIGREESAAFGADHCETARWIGKPWRRIELLVTRHFYKGEQVDRTWDLSLHLGFRRLGLFFGANITRSRGFDYSDEPNQ